LAAEAVIANDKGTTLAVVRTVADPGAADAATEVELARTAEAARVANPRATHAVAAGVACIRTLGGAQAAGVGSVSAEAVATFLEVSARLDTAVWIRGTPALEIGAGSDQAFAGIGAGCGCAAGASSIEIDTGGECAVDLAALERSSAAVDTDTP
jgi:hypothetical protein